MDDWSMETFNKMPAGQQRQAADRFCQFGEKLSTFLAATKAQGGLQDGVVTIEHVQAFTRQL
jgi:hypothetical protein